MFTGILLTIFSVCTVINASDYNSTDIQRVTKLASSNKYHPGYDTLKENGTPIWTQRTSFLYYYRPYIGKSFIWDILSMGIMANSWYLISDKAGSVKAWQSKNPSVFKDKLEPYVPSIWTSESDFERDMVKDNIYVYKLTAGSAGDDIVFAKGPAILQKIKENTEVVSWVIQDFIRPFLYDNRKTHFRILSLVIVQPNGERDYFLYKRMKMNIAAEDYDEDRLLDENEDVYRMLMTNMNQNREEFHRNPDNKGKRFNMERFLLDAEVLNSVEDSISFDEMYPKIYDLHSSLYKTMGGLLTCKSTDVSVYNNACFHIVASDVAIDSDGNPHLLELNRSMGIKGIWLHREVEEFTRGASALIKTPDSPFDEFKIHGLTPMWDNLYA